MRSSISLLQRSRVVLHSIKLSPLNAVSRHASPFSAAAIDVSQSMSQSFLRITPSAFPFSVRQHSSVQKHFSAFSPSAPAVVSEYNIEVKFPKSPVMMTVRRDTSVKQFLDMVSAEYKLPLTRQELLTNSKIQISNHSSLWSYIFSGFIIKLEDGEQKIMEITVPAIVSDSSSCTHLLEVEDLVNKADYRRVVNDLQEIAKTKHRVSNEEYYAMCSKYSLSVDEAQHLAESLHGAGQIIYFPHSSDAAVRRYLFLQPKEVISRLFESLDPIGEFAAKEITVLTGRLDDLLREFHPLDEKKIELDSKALQYSNRMTWLGFGALCAQFGVFARMTWWDFSWDIVEPMTYFVTFGTAVGCYAYFTATKAEYTYDGLRAFIFRRKQTRIYRQKQFDLKRYDELRSQIAALDNQINRLRVRLV